MTGQPTKLDYIDGESTRLARCVSTQCYQSKWKIFAVPSWLAYQRHVYDNSVNAQKRLTDLCTLASISSYGKVYNRRYPPESAVIAGTPIIYHNEDANLGFNIPAGLNVLETKQLLCAASCLYSIGSIGV